MVRIDVYPAFVLNNITYQHCFQDLKKDYRVHETVPVRKLFGNRIFTADHRSGFSAVFEYNIRRTVPMI
jgi:hypothetical protein